MLSCKDLGHPLLKMWYHDKGITTCWSPYLCALLFCAAILKAGAAVCALLLLLYMLICTMLLLYLVLAVL